MTREGSQESFGRRREHAQLTDVATRQEILEQIQYEIRRREDPYLGQFRLGRSPLSRNIKEVQIPQEYKEVNFTQLYNSQCSIKTR